MINYIIIGCIAFTMSCVGGFAGICIYKFVDKLIDTIKGEIKLKKRCKAKGIEYKTIWF